MMVKSTPPPAWAQRMETAFFHGNLFLTDSHDAKQGRRLAVHEFPGGEEPVVEDLGGKAGEFHLNAYFIGADYDLFRDAFLLALNTAGSGWLTHPWLGAIWVRAHNWTIHESNDKGGYCTIAIDFISGGQAPAAPSADKADLAIASYTFFADEAVLQYVPEPMPAASTAILKTSVLAQLDQLRNLLSFATLPLTWLNQTRTVLDGISGDLDALMAVPAQYATAWRGFADVLGGGDGSPLVDTALPQIVGSVVAMAQRSTAVPIGVNDTPLLRINLAREADLRAQLLLASAVQLALADYRVAGDRDAALSSVLRAIDAQLPKLSDTLFQAALDMRATLIAALSAQKLAPTVLRDVVAPLPATLLAHQLEVTEAVFLAVNQVRHPLFVQGRVYG